MLITKKIANLQRVDEETRKRRLYSLEQLLGVAVMDILKFRETNFIFPDLMVLIVTTIAPCICYREYTSIEKEKPNFMVHP